MRRRLLRVRSPLCGLSSGVQLDETLGDETEVISDEISTGARTLCHDDGDDDAMKRMTRASAAAAAAAEEQF